MKKLHDEDGYLGFLFKVYPHKLNDVGMAYLTKQTTLCFKPVNSIA